jgi:hypothetical protein
MVECYVGCLSVGSRPAEGSRADDKGLAPKESVIETLCKSLESGTFQFETAGCILSRSCNAHVVELIADCHQINCGPPATTNELILRNLSGLLANNEMAKRSNPALSNPEVVHRPSKAEPPIRTRARRIPSSAKSNCSQKGRIHLRRPIRHPHFSLAVR